MRTKRLGDMLLELGLITEGQLKEALDYQAKEKERLGTTLIKHHYITEGQLIDALRMQLGIDYIDLTRVDISPELSRFVPKNLAKKMTIVPVRISKDQLYLAMADPLNFMAIEEAQHTSKKKIVPMIASEPAVKRAINILYGNEGAAEAMAQMQAETAAAQEVRQGQTAAREGQENVTPMIRLVNSIIERAISENASDIHFEPTEEEMVVRMRIDGQLHRIMTIPSELKDSVISRLKIMSQLDIVEKRIPQDGRAVMHLRGKDIDMRISTLPTLYGEKVVIRILKRNEETLNRRGIGIPAVEDAKIDTLLGLTSGVIMIVGPTGSGKSSTMYTLIRELLSDRTNLITLEDPVEYHIKGATQVQINEKVGLTFASGLRSVLRQDPDIICVGEIRDGETAEIAMRAAMTGHLVITTIHTEDAISAIDRLRDMGVAPYLIAAGLRGVISQRLLRKICPNCKTQIQPPKKALEMAGIPENPGKLYWQGAGCDQCFHSGYRGRIGVFEVMLIQEELRRCILEGADRTRFLEAARRSEPVCSDAGTRAEAGRRGCFDGGRGDPDAAGAVNGAEREEETDGMYGIEELIALAAEKRASDVHLIAGLPPKCRIDGRIETLTDGGLTREDCEEYGRQLAGNAADQIEAIGQLDFSASFAGRRLRVNLFRQQGALSAAIRLLGSTIPNLSELGLPEAVNQFSSWNKGIILVTGETGSGKSTTLAAILNEINQNRPLHMITLEDPIEYVYEPVQAIINQREVGVDVESYDKGLYAALREDPDVILIGEMRDPATIETALMAAETGHLVFSTIHTNSAIDSIDRIVGVFPEDKQPQIRMQLSMTLRAVLSQQLVPRAGGQGRAAACELMMLTPAIRNLIRDGKTPQMQSYLLSSAKEGSITMDNFLIRMAKEGVITPQTAVDASQDPQELREKLAAVQY